MKKTASEFCDWHFVTVYGCDDVELEHPDTCEKDILSMQEYYGEDCPIQGEIVDYKCIISFEVDGCTLFILVPCKKILKPTTALTATG